MAVTDKDACAFYASDYHMEMIMLPYINESLNKNKKIYVFTQNNLEDTINHFIKNVNINENIKEKVLNINWKNEDEGKYKTLVEDENESIIFVKGNEDYIQKVNKNLNQIRNYRNIEIIDCYSLEEVGSKTEEIKHNYKNVLMTDGKK